VVFDSLLVGHPMLHLPHVLLNLTIRELSVLHFATDLVQDCPLLRERLPGFVDLIVKFSGLGLLSVVLNFEMVKV
jgi:hypothetical protein